MEDINRLKIVLVEKKKTSKWLSEQLKITPSTVSKWCTNTSQPDIGTLIKISKLLNITIEDLINKEYVNSVFPEIKEELFNS
jgi:transcriptional regulator with XRE-family HTH domain